MKTIIVVIALVLVAVAQTNHSTTDGQLNGSAWVTMSPHEKSIYIEAVSAGIEQGVELTLQTCADCLVPTVTHTDAVRDVDVFYRVEANRYWPIASVYVETRQSPRR